MAIRRSPHRQLPILIATCRTRRGGGQFVGTVEEEIAILAQAVLAGCLWCDVEIETAERFGFKKLRAALSPAQILVSAHDFQRLPPRLPQLVRRLRRCGGDAVKIAAACRSLADTRRLLAVISQSGNIVAVPMGIAPRDATSLSSAMRAGATPSDSTPPFAMGAAEDAASRILALREGSALAYASVEQSTAPGQLSLDAVKRVYRLNRVFASQPPLPAHRPDGPVARVAAPVAGDRALARRRSPRGGSPRQQPRMRHPVLAPRAAPAFTESSAIPSRIRCPRSCTTPPLRCAEWTPFISPFTCATPRTAALAIFATSSPPLNLFAFPVSASPFRISSASCAILTTASRSPPQ